MKGIGGNTKATFQILSTLKDENGKPVRNDVGEIVAEWNDAQTIKGWLDLASGNSSYTVYDSKVQESTHVFISDYVPLLAEIKAENARLVINGTVYDIMLIDNPMELNEQLEIYLKYTGGI